MKKNMFVVGYFGCGNAGDNATLEGTVRLFSDKQWRLSTVGSNTEYIQNFFGIDCVRHSLNKKFTLQNLLTGFDIFNTIKALKMAHVLVISGGILLRDVRFYNLPYCYCFQLLAKLLGKKVVYYSVGVGPITTKFGQFLSKTFLKSADYISVRDKGSYELLKKIGLQKKCSYYC